MSRGCKAGPALIAEGFAKRYQFKSWQKYIYDAMGESNEMINHLSVCIDIYSQYVDVEICKKAIDLYAKANAKLYKLGKAWQDYHRLD